MMRKIYCLIIRVFATLLCLIFVAKADFDQWIAIKFANSSIPNTVVLDFIESTYLNEQGHTAMFKAAGKNYNEYQKLKNAWIKRMFETGTGLLGYFKMMQKEAGSNFFKVTKRDYRKIVQGLERNHLRQFLTSIAIDYQDARKIWGGLLQERGWPHRTGQGPEEIYNDWLKFKKRKIKEEIRLREVVNLKIIL